jgi:hypothetical protein
MDNALEFYKSQIKKYKALSKQFFKKIGLFSTLRLTIFLLTVFGIYLLRNSWQWAFGVGALGTGIFLVLLSRYTDLKQKRALYNRLVKINEDELKIVSGDFYHRSTGMEFQNPKHYFSLDIDMFGNGSFFQYINRTSISEATDKLVKNLLANNIDNIELRQDAIKELATRPEWRQYYTGIAQGVSVEYSAVNIINWLKDYKPFLNRFHYWLPIVFSVLSILIVTFGILELIPIKYAGYWLLIGLGVTSVYLRKINNLAKNTDRTKNTFKQYALLLDKIETQEFHSELLKTQQDKIKVEDLKASIIFRKFTKALDALDNRNNFISAIFGNGYLLWDIMQSYHVEQWIKKYALKVEDWFDVVTFFDTYNSLGTYAFNHQQFAYPSITNKTTTISAKSLGHPLLDPEKRIDSDLELDKEQFFIVTGANMAGKSTFLRTVGLHIVMANVGLPVCAEQSSYNPVKLVTSMRTTDSLKDESSYFFSELTRLKFIVDTIDNDNNYFVILDEILKGTNSTDKAIGSKKFVERLVKLKATGIIATHDLSLTEIEADIEPIKNYFFDAQIINDELHFDYKLKQGVCQNMNASFLLKKMEIV